MVDCFVKLWGDINAHYVRQSGHEKNDPDRIVSVPSPSMQTEKRNSEFEKKRKKKVHASKKKKKAKIKQFFQVVHCAQVEWNAQYPTMNNQPSNNPNIHFCTILIHKNFGRVRMLIKWGRVFFFSFEFNIRIRLMAMAKPWIPKESSMPSA